MSNRPFTILIVSPDRAQLRRLSRFLEAFGYDIRQAADVSQALTAAQAAPPEFLLVDVPENQPADLQVVRQIRKLSNQVYTYALLLTSQVEPGAITEALEAGCDDFLARPVVFGELLARLRTGARVVEFERRLTCQSGLHHVTGLPDRAALVAHLTRRPDQEATAGWLAILDLDYFSRIETQHGRPASDVLLRAVGDFLAARLPAPSSNEGEPRLLAALGADRFAVCDIGGLAADGLSWAEETVAALGQHTFSVGPHSVTVTASCGLADLRGSETAEDLLTRAENTVQLAKSSGRSCALDSDQVDREAETWAALAADGKLFSTTLARDVMTPCALLLHADETIEQAQALAKLTRLGVIAVVDGEGQFAGVVTTQQLDAARPRSSRPRGGGSVRLVRHVMTADAVRFEESTSLAKLMEFFTGEGAPFAVIVRDRRPTGVVHCQGLAALNERLTATHFAAPAALSRSSEDLLVPDLAMAE